MRTPLRFLCAPVLGAVALAALSLPALAAPTNPRAAEAVQMNGIESAVIDRVWSNTDEYWHHGDYNRALGLIRLCVESDPDFDEAYSSGAWLLWSMGDKPAANALLANGVQRAKNKWVAHYDFAEQLMVRREYKDALPHLQAATKYPNASVMAWKQLAHAYERTGDLPKSLATWQYVVKKWPQEPAAPVNLKRVSEKIKAGKKA